MRHFEVRSDLRASAKRVRYRSLLFYTRELFEAAFRADSGMIESFILNYKRDAIASFRNYKKLAEGAIRQVSGDEFFALIDEEANSIAVIVKHIAGNLHSRWKDLFTTDGEKETRDRDNEFEITGDGRESLMETWEAGWQTLFDSLEPLTEDDFSRRITIRGEPHTLAEAINRQLTHYAYHVGQIVLLAKHFRSAEWESLSIPKNRSADFNRFLSEQQSGGAEKLDRMEAVAMFAESRHPAKGA